MQKRHTDTKRYFDEQVISTQKFILPIILQYKSLNADVNVLEIGCGEAGNLKPFLDLGCKCVGVDFSTHKIEKGKQYYSDHSNANNIELISEDIYLVKEFQSKFDIIIVRDVIEHIHGQDKFLGLMKGLLAKNGIAFFAFPPWQNPFGGHQQVCVSKIASNLPYYHLLPIPVYKFILKIFGESDSKINGLLEVKETGISIECFEKIVAQNKYKQLMRTLYFINPNYEIKFGLKPRKLNSIIAKTPFARNFFTTCAYYIISAD